jgi:hypothetical protein
VPTSIPYISNFPESHSSNAKPKFPYTIQYYVTHTF